MVATLTRTGIVPDLVMPRYGTPRNLSRETYGHEVAEVARRLGKPLMPWQQYAVDVALEIDPATGELWYEEVDITVPRQSGKTTLILALLVWRSITMARRLGPQTSTYLAQSGKMARRKLEREFIPVMRRSRSLVEVPHPRARPRKPNEFKPSMNNGSEHVLFGTDSYIQIEAPTDKGSHGDVLDMPVIDEAFAHQGDAVEQAVDAASVTRRSPQLYVVSTAGNAKSIYLYGKVRAGRRGVEQGVDHRTCYLEWSLPEDAAYDDEDAWRAYLPALGHTITIERLRAKLEKATRDPLGETTDDDEEEREFAGLSGFRRGYLNQWVEVPPDLNMRHDGKLDAARWAATAIERTPHLQPGDVVMGFDVHDGWSSIVAAAGTLASAHVEVADHRAGVSWLPASLVAMARAWRPPVIGFDGGNIAAVAAAGEIREAFEIEGLDPDMVKPLTSAQYRAACHGFWQAVEDGKVTRPRLAHDQLEVAGAQAMERMVGKDSWVWDRANALTSVSPLVAATCARALLNEGSAGVFTGSFHDLDDYLTED